MKFSPLWTTGSLVTAVGLTVAISAIAQNTGDDDMAEPATTEVAATDDGFENQTDRLSYAIGMDIGGSFKSQDIEINPKLLSEAMIAAYEGKESRLSEEQAMAAIQQFQQQMQAKQMQQMAQQQEEAATKNTAEAEKFFAENKTKEGVKETDTGLQYMIIEEGEGKKPGPNDMVTVHYSGKLLDGTEFDSSYERGEPATFGIDQVIPGFGEGLQLMPVGSKGKLFIPGDQAYGVGGRGPGGPNAALIFDVEVLDTKAPEDVAGNDDAPAEGAEIETPAMGD